MKTFLWLVLLYLLFLCAPANATTLSAAAAALAPGQFVNVTGMINLQATAAAYDPAPASPGPGYDGSQPSAWDPATGKLYIEMTEHGVAAACPDAFPNFPNWCWKKLWTYTDATNTWDAAGPYPSYTSGGGPVSGTHTWGYTAWDSANKTFYIRGHDTNIGGFWWSFFRYCATNSPASYCASQLGQWQQITGFNPPSGSQVGTQLGWMPTLNGGTLLAFDTDGNNAGCGALFGYREGVGWATIDSGASCKFPFSTTTLNRIIYSQQKNVAIFGPTGGSALQWWKIDAAGNRSTLDPAPCAFTTNNNGFSQTAEDPAGTGDIIFIGCTEIGQMWRLNPNAAPGAQWTQMHAALDGGGATPQICNVRRTMSASELRCGFDFVAMSIPTYGVIGFWKMRLGVPGGIGPAQQAAEFWLYKPTSVSSDVIPPTVSITAPTAGATVTGSAVTLTATANDTVGVAGVQFKVDGVATGTEDTVAPYSISWNSTTVSNGSHTITATARDAAGNTATSTGVSVTVSNGGADFATRCIGAFFCNGFDTAADLGGDGFGNARGHGPPDDSGSQFCGVNNCPTIDTTVKVSGAGAMKFTIPPGGSGKDGGSYWANPSTDLSVRFGAGQTWYVQFRQRVTSTYADAAANNNKIHWVSGRPDLPGCTPSTSAQGNCFATCTENEVVNQNQYTDPTKAFPRWYTACPGPNNFELITPVTPGQYNLENGRTAPGCLYDNVVAGNIFPPNGNCFPFSFDQWVTWSYKITLGAIGTGTKGGLCFDANNPSIPLNKQNCYYGGQILARAGLDGQPLTTVLNWTGPMVAVDNRLDINGNFVDPTELRYGKVWFAPYTGAGSVLPSGANMWVDELIMSLNPIADPSATPDTTNPTVAITSPIPPTTSTTTSPIAVSGTATDNVGVTSVTWTCLACVTKGGTATSSPGTSISWLITALDLGVSAGSFTLNVVAHDAAGNVSSAATLTIAYSPQPIRYASITGGGTACTVITTPCTLTVALGQLLASETLFLRAGTYTTYLNGDTFNWPSGTAVLPTTIAGYPGETVIIRPASDSIINMSAAVNGAKSFITFRNLILDGGVMNSGTQMIGSNGVQANIEFDHITLQNNPDNNGWSVCSTGCNNWWVHDSTVTNLLGGYAIYQTGQGLMFEHNTINGCAAYAIHNYHQGFSDVSNNTYRYNTITNCGTSAQFSAAAILASGSNVRFYGNLLYNNRKGGLILDDCTDCLVYNNTIYASDLAGGGYNGIQVGNSGTAVRPVIQNNIVAKTTGAGADFGLFGNSAPTHDHNLCEAAGTWCDTTQAVNAIFINPATLNFQLNTGSLALNTGATLPAPYNTDIAGITRPQGAAFDLGAYELNASIIQPVVTIVNPTANTKLTVQAPLFSLGGTSNLP